MPCQCEQQRFSLKTLPIAAVRQSAALLRGVVRLLPVGQKRTVVTTDRARPRELTQ